MAGEKIGTLDLDTLAKRETGGLSDSEIEAIRLSALKKVDGKPEAKKEEPKKEEPKQEEKKEESKENKVEISEEEKAEEALLAKKDEELSEEEKPKKAEIAEKRRKKEEERILNAKEDDLSEEDKAKKPELLKAQEEANKKTQEEEIQAYAKESSITVDEARQDLESISKIRDKYKDDPKQLAKANLYIQRLYSKSENEIKSLKDAKPAQQEQEVTVDGVMKWMQEGRLTANGKKISSEDIIEAYREANPDITDTLEDEKVLKLAAKDYKQKVDEAIKNQRAEISIKAKEKRESLLSGLSDKDKNYLPEIKPLLEKLSDVQIMNEGFSVEPYILYAKGKIFEATTERLEKEKADFGKKEFERGKQEAKILGTKAPAGSPPKKKEGSELTEAQKKRALQMYDSPNITEEKAFEMYKEYLKKTGADV